MRSKPFEDLQEDHLGIGSSRCEGPEAGIALGVPGIERPV